MKLAILLLLVGLAAAAPKNPETCRKALVEAGFSKNFNETIAHTIHSMTVQGLHLFNKRATEHNRVPTVNMDRHSPVKVLSYAPNDPLNDAFFTPTMNTIDKILNNIGADNDGLGAMWSPLERVVHKFHMWDVWRQVLEVYEKRAFAEPSDALCECLMDTEHNGIYKAVTWVSDHYDSGTPITLLNRPIPKLTDAGSWGIWRERLLHYYRDQALQDSAAFMFCATQDF